MLCITLRLYVLGIKVTSQGSQTPASFTLRENNISKLTPRVQSLN